MRKSHAAPITSSRIQRVYQALKRAGSKGLTTIRLGEICNSTRPASDASEARSNGIGIACDYLGLSDGGRRIYRYKLLE